MSIPSPVGQIFSMFLDQLTDQMVTAQQPCGGIDCPILALLVADTHLVGTSPNASVSVLQRCSANAKKEAHVSITGNCNCNNQKEVGEQKHGI